MLRDAAMLQLELFEAAMAEGMSLKDATPYNIQFRGHRTVFIDIGSFIEIEPGAVWAGFNREMILANVRKLKKLITAKQWAGDGSEWGGYAEFHNYSDADHGLEERYVASIVKKVNLISCGILAVTPASSPWWQRAMLTWYWPWTCITAAEKFRCSDASTGLAQTVS